MRAIVLEGGGGKGAYQMGALLALNYAGKTFDLIAGSSVGALNGFLLATDQLGNGFRLWWNMTPFSVLALHPLSLVGTALIPLYGIICGISKGMRYQSRDGAKASLLVSMGCLPVLGILGLVVMSLVPGHRPSLIDALSQTAILFLVGLFFSVPAFFTLFGLSIFVPAPLKHAIAELVQKRDMRIPLLITVTEMVTSFDPDDPTVVAVTHGVLMAFEAAQPFPEYVDAKDMANDELLQLLLASSALPHGVFPPVARPTAQYVDGGLSDNLPVYAALQGDHVDDLTVICLRPTALTRTRQAWKEADRKIRLRNIPVTDAKHLRGEFLNDSSYYNTRKVWPPRILPFGDPPYWPEHEMLICPNKSLGNIFTGTMNFRRKQSRKLLKLGWEDAWRMMGCPETVPATLPVDELKVWN